MASERLIKLGLATADSDPLETLATGAVEGWPLGLLQDAAEDARAGVQRLRAQVTAAEKLADAAVQAIDGLSFNQASQAAADGQRAFDAALSEFRKEATDEPA